MSKDVLADVLAEIEALVEIATSALKPDAEGMVYHDKIGHSAGLQCDKCEGYPHATCVSLSDLRAILTRYADPSMPG